MASKLAASDQQIFDEEEMRQKIEREVRMEIMEAQLSGTSPSYQRNNQSSSQNQNQVNNNNNNSSNAHSNLYNQYKPIVTRQSPSNSFSASAASYTASSQYPDDVSISSYRDDASSASASSFTQKLDYFQQLDQQQKLEERRQLQQLQRQQQELEQQIQQNELKQLQTQQAQQLEMEEEIRATQRELEAEMLKTGG